MTDPIFRETEPNMPHTRWWSGYGWAEFGFGVGALLAFVGAALVFLPAALFAAGALLMVVAWRNA
jgi:hypothetical protein